MLAHGPVETGDVQAGNLDIFDVIAFGAELIGGHQDESLRETVHVRYGIDDGIPVISRVGFAITVGIDPVANDAGAGFLDVDSRRKREISQQ